MPENQLWIPTSARAEFTKNQPGVPMGNQFGVWSGRDLSYLNMPGGSLLQFDLSRLTLQDFRVMRDNYQINMSLSILTFMLHQMNWKIVCEDEALGKKCEDILREVWTPLQRGIAQSYWAGYCVTPETPILCADLIWRAAGDLKVDQAIVAFDEDPVCGNLTKAARRYRNATITRNDRAIKPCLRITTDIGDPITASDDHPWLVWTSTANSTVRKSGPQIGQPVPWPGLTWKTTAELRIGDKIAFFGKPWERDESRGPERRLIADVPQMLDDAQALRREYTYDLATVTSMQTVGEQEVASITTSTGTFITGGYLSHNSPMVIDWNNDAQSSTVKIDRIKDLVPEECWVNWKKVEGSKQAFNPQSPLFDGLTSSPANVVGPVFYEYDGIRQFPMPGLIDGMFGMGTSTPSPIPAEATFWYSLLMENGDYYGRKLLKAAFQPWYFSMLIHLFSNRYFERFGEPVPIGRADFDSSLTDDSGKKISGRDAMFQILENLRSRGVVVLPSERVPWGDGTKSDYAYEIEYLESQMRGADFERYLTRLDEEMSLALFTPLLVSRTGDVGSQNLGVTHLQLYLWMLNALAMDQKHAIDNYILKPLVKFNGHKGSPPAYWVHRQLGKDNQETLRAVLTALVTQREARPDLNELGEALGLTLEETIALELPTGPPVPGEPGAPGPDGKPGPAGPSTQPTATKTVPFDPERAPEVFDPVPGPAPRLPRNKVAVTAKASTTAPIDTRGNRPDRTVVKGINAKISARMRSAFAKGTVFTPGHERQMAEAVGPQASAWFYQQLGDWVAEAGPLANDATQFNKMLDGALDHLLDRLAPAD